MNPEYKQQLLYKVKETPRRPGVYLFKDEKSNIIYIGKASSLRNRVSSYFHEGSTGSPKTDYMITLIRDLEFIVTETEAEALLLENNLIKQKQPKYNIDLKDDKSYPYIKLTIKDDYPTVFLTRQKTKDGSLYYGPYVNAGSAKNMLRLMRKHLLIRSCTVPIKRIKRPCLMFHIHRCLGPCRKGMVDKERYRDIINDVQLLLEGKNSDLVSRLQEKMKSASNEQRYEQAASYRDFIEYLLKIGNERQIIIQGHSDEDIIGYFYGERRIITQIFHIRNGLIVGRKEFVLTDHIGVEPGELLRNVISQYYFDEIVLPPVIVVPGEINDEENLLSILKKKRGGAMEFVVPQRGRRKRLLDLAMENSRVSYDSIHSVDKDAEALQDLRRKLNLDYTPMVIEGFDISTLQGEQNVASMVRFVNGRPDKAGYRKFKIKTVEGIDDYASMNEVVTRRYKRLLSENKNLPDLILIDGGPGQLGSALEALESVGLFDQSIISLAKREELIYTPGGGEPLRLSDNSPALNLVKRIRDEAHRFAITFQKNTRKAKIRSSLEDIPGIGPATRKKLLQEFRSVQKIKTLSLHDLRNILDSKNAETIYDFYHSEKN